MSSNLRFEFTIESFFFLLLCDCKRDIKIRKLVRLINFSLLY